ncbi:uncharacterized protein BO88DRAFT_461740 [Aspergillus vadensis CBS 113365]|uniref:Uncharacterized protein n=1 Tax=Aspergillus vadensis (strain CBS 113365 / IMI 142717 / IBT 24658) TaxID=1448311 RepID=A0A319B944_ASPVC|nr:hypothetical protein BO88DRAFT_461740 [Aspergillus vadensis CBS 113365]PYH69426.1 hypothetical protein BO88DRAFT_461740 [Aspergillus vadensis CBS 113365]
MMDERSWAQQTVDRFFEYRQSPTQLDCDDYARRITGASTVQEVAIPGSLSYTILCTDSSEERRDLIVSVRQQESALDQTVIELARFIHGDLVQEATFHSKMPGSDPHLLVYTMACLSGSPCLQLFSTETELSPKEEARYMCFVKHIASTAVWHGTGHSATIHWLHDLSGWHSYTCRERMISSFWDEFWAHCRAFDETRQHEIRTMSMQATKIGAVMRYAGMRSADGSPSEELTTSNWALKTLKTLLCC